MKPRQARAGFDAYLSQCEMDLSGLDPALGVETMIGFYTAVRADSLCALGVS